jgi:hypothetical protein
MAKKGGRAMFKGKVYCAVCNKKHKYKKRAKKPVYVCSTYDNRGADACIRNQVDEEKLIWYVYGHFSIREEDVTEEFIREHVDAVYVDGESGFSIHYNNGEKSLISPNKLIR